MRPILFHIPIAGGIPIYGYGVMMALAFLLGSYYVKKEAIRVGSNPNQMLDLIFYIIIAALLGSRILHVLVNERETFLQNPLSILKLWEGGLVFYGGFIAAVIVSLFFFRRHRLNVWKHTDIFIPAVSLGHAIGRIGCFLAGCCHGRPLLQEAWYSVIFPANAHSFAPAGIPLYPTQLMETMGELLIFSYLFFRRKRKRFEGELFASYLLLYSILRSTIEYFRGDLERGFVIESVLSTSQFISIFMFSLGVILFLALGRKKQNVE